MSQPVEDVNTKIARFETFLNETLRADLSDTATVGLKDSHGRSLKDILQRDLYEKYEKNQKDIAVDKLVEYSDYEDKLEDKVFFVLDAEVFAKFIGLSEGNEPGG